MPGHDAGPADGGRPARDWLRRVNPAAKLVAAVLVVVGLLPVVDPVSAGVVLVAVLALVPFAGVDRRTVLALGPPLVLMAASVGLVNLLFGQDGPLGAAGMAVRLLAIALPGVLAGLTSDATEMADALVQRLRLPERPALGVLAALRLVPLLAAQWHTLGLARRARGLEAGRNPLTAVSIFAGKAFALLVRSIRTGTQLAVAMDARAFGTGPRTHARVSRWRASDTWLVVGTVALLLAAHAASLALGTWRAVLG